MIDGIRVGQYERIGDGWLTGTTVVLCPAGAVGGVDSRGGAPGTRETDLLDPRNLVDRVHAVMLTGGSAYGLGAATGVMEWLEQHGIGWPMGTSGEVVPIVPAAVLYDLGRGGEFRNRPTAEFGWEACAAATADPVRTGNAGAGAGAKAGGFKGGLGFSSVRTKSGVTVEVVAAINAVGSIVDSQTGRLYSDVVATLREPTPAEISQFPVPTRSPLNTTIAVVSTDAALTKAQCQRLAGSAQDGLAIAVRPAHLMSDGDTVFALATGAVPVADSEQFDEVLGAAAAAFVEAVFHGILSAQSTHSLRSYRDTCPSVFA